MPYTTPVDNLSLYDGLPPAQAIVAAWTIPGSNPTVHATAQRHVRAAMPLLARAIERLVAERITQGE